MQPAQTGSFLRGAAQTAAGVAGGALLFQGINSLFSGHSGLAGGALAGTLPQDSLSATTIADQDRNRGDEGYQQADYGGDTDFGGDDDFGGGGDDYA